MRRYPLLALAVLVSASSAAFAQIERSHDAHVHGRSQIDLVYEAGTLQLDLIAPGMDLAGFEHPPVSDAETAGIATAIATLQDSASWLAFEPDGRCTVTSVVAHAHGFGQPGADDHEKAAEADHAHEDHDEETGDADHVGHSHDDEHGHTEFHASLTATCDETPDALRIGLHERFPALELLRVDLITDTAQNRIELARGQTRVPLSD